MSKPALQRYRLITQMGFFALFTLTPIFDLLRYDLTEKHAYFLTYQWHIGIDDLIAGRVDGQTATVNLILYLFLPILGTGALLLLVAWKWGRLYCGWLCPHFSVVETINRLMVIATGKHSVWDKKETPPWEPDGSPTPRDKRYWLLVVPAAVGFAFAWAVASEKGELSEWFAASWGFAKQILPLLLMGVLVAGFLLGRPGHEGFVPSARVAALVGGNSLGANLFAAVSGAFMYFATLTEIPIIEGLLGSGMGRGPALSLLLAGPALSLPSMIVLRTIMGTKRTVVFVLLVVVLSTLTGFVFGLFN